MKWSEMRRIAESHGWYLWRNGANHDVYRHPDKGDTILISRHGSEEVKNGIYFRLKKIIDF